MKIKLTETEAVTIIKESLRQIPTEISDVEIERGPNYDAPASASFALPRIDLMRVVLVARAARSEFIGGSHKIAAIKAMRREVRRQGFDIGLAEAKVFVEDVVGICH